MAAEPNPDTSVLLNRITVSSILDEDGDQALTVAYTPDIGISQALGMLEYAKISLIEAYQKGRGE